MVGRIMTPKDILVLIPGTWNQVTWQRRVKGADRLILRQYVVLGDLVGPVEWSERLKVVRINS